MVAVFRVVKVMRLDPRGPTVENVRENTLGAPPILQYLARVVLAGF
jgi:hypothetical protein